MPAPVSRPLLCSLSQLLGDRGSSEGQLLPVSLHAAGWVRGRVGLLRFPDDVQGQDRAAVPLGSRVLAGG